MKALGADAGGKATSYYHRPGWVRAVLVCGRIMLAPSADERARKIPAITVGITPSGSQMEFCGWRSHRESGISTQVAETRHRTVDEFPTIHNPKA